MKQKVECLVEIFDQEHMRDNIAGCLLYHPDAYYIFVSNQADPRKLIGLQGFLKAHCPETEVHLIEMEIRGTNEIREQVATKMEELEQAYEEILVEICGGNPLLNIAVFHHCIKKGIPTISIDYLDGIVSNWQEAEAYAGKFDAIELSLDMMVQLNGGCIEKNMHRIPEEVDYRTILDCADFILQNPKDYMRFSQYLQHCMRNNELRDPLHIRTTKEQVVQNNAVVTANETWFCKMEKYGLITELSMEGDMLEFHYPSAFAKESLLVTGSWLEMYAYISACLSGEFDEVMESIVIDWNGILGEEFDVKNEIDLLMRKGQTPVFISCKMRKINAVDLNEIKQYAERFGGPEAKAVIITSNEISQKENTIKNRAQEMGVIVIDRTGLPLKAEIE